ncbi:MAG: ABC transporter substrate-binding protein, partial [Anaerolineaceae bacterium]|nr:ABC transporter substrate-binding protein [Anaerolineaceae bacterium]
MKPILSKIFLISFIFVIMLSACAPAQSNLTEENSPVPEASQNNTVPQEPEPVVDPGLEFVDATGKLVSLPALPGRIVVAGRATPYVLDTIYLFPDAAKKLAALEVRGFDTQAFLGLVDPDVTVKNMLERDAGPEQIAPYQPDLVIVKNISLGQLGAALEEISIPVMGLNLETPAYFYEDIRALGKVFDNANRAEEIVAFYQGIETQVSEMMTGLQDSERPSVVVLQYSEDGGEISFKVPPASYLQTTMVQNAGGNPIWLDVDGGSDGWIQVGLEQIAVWNPEVIFVVNYSGDSVETAQQLLQSPTWAGLQAVENEQVYGFPADFASWDLIDPRWILGQQWLATILQPERAAEIDLQAQVVSFYQVLYRLSEAQIKESILP